MPLIQYGEEESVGAIHEANPALKQLGVDKNTEEYRINRAVTIAKWVTTLTVGPVSLIAGYLIGLAQ